MGYMFSLNYANMLANMTQKKTVLIKEAILTSREERENFRDFLNHFGENVLSGNPQKYQSICNELSKLITEILLSDYAEDNMNIDFCKKIFDSFLLIDQLSNILSSFHNKFMILDKDSNIDYLRRAVGIEDERNPSLFLQPILDSVSDISVLNAFPHMDKALLNLDKWPGILVWKGVKEGVFIPITAKKPIESIVTDVLSSKSLPNAEKTAKEDRQVYIIHLSDLHIGYRDYRPKLTRLKSLIRTKVREIGSNSKIQVVISGDAVDSPTEENFQTLADFISDVEDLIRDHPVLVLGNHDYCFRGFTINKRKKRLNSLRNEILKSEIISISDEIAVIPIDSNTDEALARGKVGEEQLSRVGIFLENIPNNKEMTFIFVLHHHLLEIDKTNRIDSEITQRIFPRDSSDFGLKLVDSSNVINWLKDRQIRLVLHGHKHIPYLNEIDNSVIIVGCGSSTGKPNHPRDGKTVLCYNLIKITEKKIYVNMFYEEILGSGEKVQFATDFPR